MLLNILQKHITTHTHTHTPQLFGQNANIAKVEKHTELREVVAVERRSTVEAGR